MFGLKLTHARAVISDMIRNQRNNVFGAGPQARTNARTSMRRDKYAHKQVDRLEEKLSPDTV